MDGSPDGVPFAVICLMVRVVEALGAAALITSSFAIIANTFPDNVTAMFVRTHNHTHTYTHTHTHTHKHTHTHTTRVDRVND